MTPPLGNSGKGAAWVETYERAIAQYDAAEVREIVAVYDWRLKGANGEIVCSSMQGFTERNDAAEAALHARDLLAQITEVREA